jgi:hypothetical protein
LQLRGLKKQYANEEAWKQYTNENLYLIHAINDTVIEYPHFMNNVNEAQLEKSNWMVSRRGGHNFLKHELMLVSAIIFQLNALR